MTHLRLADGTIWPEPDFAAADRDSVEWKLRHQPDTLTRQDALLAAWIIASYNYLFEPSMTAKAMGQKVAMLRRAFREQQVPDDVVPGGTS